MTNPRALIVTHDGHRYGLLTPTGETALACEHAAITQFENDTYAIKKRDYYQLYGAALHLLTPIRFLAVASCSSEGYTVQVRTKSGRKAYGLISPDGSWIIKPHYYKLAMTELPGPVWYLSYTRQGRVRAHDKQGRIVRSWPRKSCVEYLGEGYFLETSSEKLIDPATEKCGVLPELKTNYTYQISDMYEEKVAIDLKDATVSAFKGGVCSVDTPCGTTLFNTRMESLTGGHLYKGELGSDGLCVVQNQYEGPCHYLDATGKRHFARTFIRCTTFMQGNAWVEELDGWKGFIDRDGEHLYPCEYPLVEGYNGEYAIVEGGGSNTAYGIIDRQGEVVQWLPFLYENLTQYCCYRIYNPDKLMHLNGETLMREPRMQELLLGKYGFCISDGTHYITVNTAGEIIKRTAAKR